MISCYYPVIVGNLLLFLQCNELKKQPCLTFSHQQVVSLLGRPYTGCLVLVDHEKTSEAQVSNQILQAHTDVKHVRVTPCVVSLVQLTSIIVPSLILWQAREADKLRRVQLDALREQLQAEMDKAKENDVFAALHHPKQKKEKQLAQRFTDVLVPASLAQLDLVVGMPFCLFMPCPPPPSPAFLACLACAYHTLNVIIHEDCSHQTIILLSPTTQFFIIICTCCC